MTPRLFFALTAALCVLTLAAILWIDRPLAHFLAQFRLGHSVFTSKPLTLPVMIAFAVAGLALGLGHLLAGRRLPRWVEAAMLAGIAVLVGQLLVHDLLKPLFGRILPTTYLATGRHGFHWFLSFHRASSFPSTHSAEAAAILSVLWIHFPRGRGLYVALMALLAVGLMLGQWHYLGDILAGAGIGTALGLGATLLWRRLAPARFRTTPG